MTQAHEVGIKEARSVMELVRRRFGDDFSDFSLTIFVRRLGVALEKLGLPSVDALHDMLQHGPREDYDRFLWAVLPNTTELFRDPSFWRYLRDTVLPSLASREGTSFTIWQAALDSGEELFSLLILLEELGYDECTVYSSYMGAKMLQQSSTGFMPVRTTDVDSANFTRCQLHGQFSDYVEERKGHRVFVGKLLPRVQYVQQRPVFSLPPKQEASLVLCRNQLLYFNATLCYRNLEVLAKSLRAGGYLALGVQERLANLQNCSTFTAFNERESIYRRVRSGS